MRATLKEPLLAPTSAHEEKLRAWVKDLDVPLLFGLQTCTAGVALTESPRGAIGYACGAGALLVICGVCQACAGSRAGGAVRAVGGAAAMAAGAFQLAVPNALAVLCVALAVGFLVRNDLGAAPTAEPPPSSAASTVPQSPAQLAYQFELEKRGRSRGSSAAPSPRTSVPASPLVRGAPARSPLGPHAASPPTSSRLHPPAAAPPLLPLPPPQAEASAARLETAEEQVAALREEVGVLREALQQVEGQVDRQRSRRGSRDLGGGVDGSAFAGLGS